MSDFRWDGDDADSVILPHQPRTAVYAGRAGNVIVRQEADAHEEYDPQLLFTPQGALAAAWAMIEQAHKIGLPHPLPVIAQDAGPRRPPIPTASPKSQAQDGLSEAAPLLPSMQEAAE